MRLGQAAQLPQTHPMLGWRASNCKESGASQERLRSDCFSHNARGLSTYCLHCSNKNWRNEKLDLIFLLIAYMANFLRI